MRNHLCTFGPLAVFLSDSFARTAGIYQPESLRSMSMAAFGEAAARRRDTWPRSGKGRKQTYQPV